MTTKIYDVCIVGAGPAGSTCALQLKDSNLNVALFDKEKFPRIKPCGDAIPGKAFKIMRQIDPDLEKILWENPMKEEISASRIVSPNNKDITIEWVNKAYNCPRSDFDNYLLQMVKKHSPANVFEETGFINAVDRDDHIELITAKTNKVIKAKMVIGADGANSVISRKLTDYKVDHNHNSTALRAYYKGVKDIRPGVTELFFIKKYMPGYFWIFPVGGGIINAGFGMLSETILNKKININHAFADVIENHSEISQRFNDAELVGDIKGHNLPLGSRQIRISGNRFMLTGDAASLIDPIDGHGIDKAMLSGKMAAEQVRKCFQENDFSAGATKEYEILLFSRIGPEMKKNYNVLKILAKYPFLLNGAIGLAQISFIRKYFLKVLYG